MKKDLQYYMMMKYLPDSNNPNPDCIVKIMKAARITNIASTPSWPVAPSGLNEFAILNQKFWKKWVPQTLFYITTSDSSF